MNWKNKGDYGKMPYKKPTSTDYTKFFIEDKDMKPDLTKIDVLRSRKSNLIMNLKYMKWSEKRKAARKIIAIEIQLANDNLSKGDNKGATFNLSSAINTRKHCQCFTPLIENDLLREAWKKKDPWILLGSTMKERMKKRKGKIDR